LPERIVSFGRGSRIENWLTAFQRKFAQCRFDFRGKLRSEILSRFSIVGFEPVSPYRDSRYRGSPKPGKKKNKSYDNRSAILIVHRS
jgi:hypothetical protein